MCRFPPNSCSFVFNQQQGIIRGRSPLIELTSTRSALCQLVCFQCEKRQTPLRSTLQYFDISECFAGATSPPNPRTRCTRDSNKVRT